jgi:hypothetical protein
MRPRLILIGASPLHWLEKKKHLHADKWNVVDLTVPGWRVSSTNVTDAVRDSTDLMTDGSKENTILVVQLLDNSSFLIKNVSGESHLPV